MTKPATMCGRQIHQAAHALHLLRDTALEKAGITFVQSKVLEAAPGDRDELIRRLVELTMSDPTEIATAIDELVHKGLVAIDGGDLEATAAGQDVRQRAGATRTDLHSQLYDGISADDLATTGRVLDQITERAKALRGPGSFSASDWNDTYASPPRWDLGRPQPAFRALADAGAIRGRVLDVGCGTGEHVLMCAGLGLDATGIDLATAALLAAERKARDRGLPARFLQRDVRKLTDIEESFDTVLDCGLFHIFGDEDRAAYLDSVWSALVPGGRYFMLCFSDQEPGDHGPRRLTRDELTAVFTDGWRIDSIEPTTLDSLTDPDGVRAWLVALTKKESAC